MQTFLKNDASARPFRNLARRREAAILKEVGGLTDTATLLNKKLETADELQREGKITEARQLWESIDKLYGHKPEFQPQASRAQERLKSLGGSKPNAR